jgi:hypothetical protein
MPENVPRRMMRFYRGAEKKQQVQENYKEEDFLAPDGRPILSGIPSMSYEDLEIDKKNYEELKKIEERNVEEKLALDEVESFKNKNNRLPNKEESNRIAETLYTQLKNTDMSKIYPEDDLQPTRGHNRRGNRRIDRTKGKEEQPPTINEGIKQEKEQLQQPFSSNIVDVKSLLEDDTDFTSDSKKKDEFDLGLDEDFDENKEMIKEDIEDTEEDLDKKTKCPNCKKGVEKIIYCSKCGNAFCEKCAKKEGEHIFCPKCNQKIK